MVIVLKRARSHSSFKQTESLLNRLITLTIETGAITAGFALLTLVLFKVTPEYYYFLVAEFILGKMYSNVLFTTLNGRRRSPDMSPNLSNMGTLNFGTELGRIASPQLSREPRAGSASIGVVISTTVNTDASTRDESYAKGSIAF
ncbi:hypothetical protein B0H15DRAFT_518880 [Mycena belliarum]|uniref:DUF6534 domain-containing protein n=1 Tax=Mycena belliarum TaxID=1033014 RepID=A0AAD6XLE1_9AGAR|nr:hypothetical protein B0H15DRAFT_518880 [Mycena belliae]